MMVVAFIVTLIRKTAELYFSEDKVRCIYTENERKHIKMIEQN